MRTITTYHHPGFATPIGEHIMPMRKFAMVADVVKNYPFVRMAEPEPVTERDLLRVHDFEYVKAVQTGEPRTLAESQKFPWSPQLYPAVCLTNGAALAAARTALNEGYAAALCSGFHHSHSARGEGYCTFNGLIVSIDALRDTGLLQSAAILDMDLHYGNGTAKLLADRPYVLGLSIYGNDYLNNKSIRDVTTLHHTDGANHLSAALPAECDRTTLLKIMDQHLPKLLTNSPQLLIYQAGADPYFEDPYSPLKLNHEDLLKRDEVVFDFAKQHHLPIAWVLAGGYTQDTSKVVKVHTNTFIAWKHVFGD